MKSLKAAAVLAGTLIAAGAAAPAYAQESLDLARTGVDTGLRTAVPFELMPAHESETLTGADDESLLGTTKEAAATVNEAKPVHGDLGLHA
ncbi:hypothetical protein ACFXAE_30295 [Streptomyces sp. NPDC059454]|jgi:hypothetical protein|uniref:hypothetical protein n=1 Tax=Streptomyces sp. NPDC059454 TaxID=3346836 RepID=UPI0036BCE421